MAGLLVLAVVCAIAGGGTVDAIALGIFGVGSVLATVFVFYEIGRSEDYEREAQGAIRSTTQPPPSRR